MSKKLFYNDVKNYIESYNYVLLSDEYKNNKTKLKVKCDKGHEYEVAFGSFKKGRRCPICSSKKRLTYNDVKQYVEEHGYTLLSDTYKNSYTKLKVKCPEGHEYEVTFNKFKNGRRCFICKRKLKYSKKRLAYDDVKQYIEDQGYSLLSDTYRNAKTKLKVRCPEGHEYEVTWSNFKNGYRCPFCAGNVKLTYNDVKQYIEDRGYSLLSDTYKNAKTKLKVRCPEGHEYEINFNGFQQGRRCPICKGGVRYDYDYVKEYIEEQNYTLLSDTYKNSDTKLELKCPEGHKYETPFKTFKNGNRCPVCSNNISKGEKEVVDFVKSIIGNNIEILCNDRTQIVNPLTGHNLELDLFIPELKIAIEYNGIYWHSLPERKQYDKIKVKQCKEKGIKLLIIDDSKWTNNKEVEMKIIKNFLEG